MKTTRNSALGKFDILNTIFFQQICSSERTKQFFCLNYNVHSYCDHHHHHHHHLMLHFPVLLSSSSCQYTILSDYFILMGPGLFHPIFKRKIEIVGTYVCSLLAWERMTQFSSDFACFCIWTKKRWNFEKVFWVRVPVRVVPVPRKLSAIEERRQDRSCFFRRRNCWNEGNNREGLPWIRVPVNMVSAANSETNHDRRTAPSCLLRRGDYRNKVCSPEKIVSTSCVEHGLCSSGTTPSINICFGGEITGTNIKSTKTHVLQCLQDDFCNSGN
jgi:hypothetical protein